MSSLMFSMPSLFFVDKLWKLCNCYWVIILIKIRKFLFLVFTYISVLNSVKGLIFGRDLSWLLWLGPKNRQFKRQCVLEIFAKLNPQILIGLQYSGSVQSNNLLNLYAVPLLKASRCVVTTSLLWILH